MEEPFTFDASFSQAGEINICVFPHLEEFLVIDLRDTTPRSQQLRLLSTQEILTEEFYQSIEEEFSHLLRRSGKTFLELTNLPQQVDSLIRQEALRIVLEILSEDRELAFIPEVSIFLCTGPALSLPATQLAHAVEGFFTSQADPGVVNECVALLEKLMHAEREAVKQQEREQIREALEGDEHQYFTLWENQN